MTERKEGVQPEQSPQNLLKADLQQGRISAEDFVRRVRKLDQDDPERREAGNNIKLLTSPEVTLILEQDEDLATKLYNDLSLYYVHTGQDKQIAGDPNARKDFELALQAAERSYDDEGAQDWKRYLRATLAYLDRDIETLELLAIEITDEANKAIVDKMIAELKKV